MKMPTKDEMRAEFHRLNGELAAAMATIAPKQAAYEAKRAEIEALEARDLEPLANELKAARDGLGIHAMQQQIALLSRALGGETGAAPQQDQA
ncbi:MAG: hypothetical protein J0H71_05575 [Rhizobiales bacterium]|nr:hypothetical protein [Hyphomicrobiales bacterium]